MFQIFRSPTVAKIIAVLAMHESEELGANDLARQVSVARPNILQALEYLEADGIVTHRAIGRKYMYRIVTEHPLYPELKGLAIKTFGGQEAVLRAIRDDKAVLFAAIYGSIARREEKRESDLDVLIIITDEESESADYRLATRLALAAQQLGRPIHPAIHPRSEFRQLRKSNPVMRSILSSPMVVLKGVLADV